MEQTRSLATVPDLSEGIRWSCHRQGSAIRMAEVKSDNREGESEENPETKDQRVSDSSTTEVREGQLLRRNWFLLQQGWAKTGCRMGEKVRTLRRRFKTEVHPAHFR